MEINSLLIITEFLQSLQGAGGTPDICVQWGENSFGIKAVKIVSPFCAELDIVKKTLLSVFRECLICCSQVMVGKCDVEQGELTAPELQFVWH